MVMIMKRIMVKKMKEGGDNDSDDGDADGNGDNDDEEKTQASLDIFGSAVRAPTGEEARGDPDDYQHNHL